MICPFHGSYNARLDRCPACVEARTATRAETTWKVAPASPDDAEGPVAKLAARFDALADRLDKLERDVRVNLRECRGARGVDVGENTDAVCDVVGSSPSGEENGQ